MSDGLIYLSINVEKNSIKSLMCKPKIETNEEIDKINIEGNIVGVIDSGESRTAKFLKLCTNHTRTPRECQGLANPNKGGFSLYYRISRRLGFIGE